MKFLTVAKATENSIPLNSNIKSSPYQDVKQL